MPSPTKCTHFASRKRVHGTTSLTTAPTLDAEREANNFFLSSPFLVSHFFYWKLCRDVWRRQCSACPILLLIVARELWLRQNGTNWIFVDRRCPLEVQREAEKPEEMNVSEAAVATIAPIERGECMIYCVSLSLSIVGTYTQAVNMPALWNDANFSRLAADVPGRSRKRKVSRNTSFFCNVIYLHESIGFSYFIGRVCTHSAQYGMGWIVMQSCTQHTAAPIGKA